MPAIPDLEGAKAVKAIAAAKAEGVKVGAATAKAEAAKATAVKEAAVKAEAAKATAAKVAAVKAGAAKATAAKVAAAKASASGIFSGGTPVCHLGLGLGLGIWGPIFLVSTLCTTTAVCVYWLAKQAEKDGELNPVEDEAEVAPT